MFPKVLTYVYKRGDFVNTNDISLVIYNQRKQLNMSMQELADKVGVSKSTIKKWESGQISNMRRDKIAKVAYALDLSPADLMGWTETPTPSDKIDLFVDKEAFIHVYESQVKIDNQAKRLKAYAECLMSIVYKLNYENYKKLENYAEKLWELQKMEEGN